MKKHASTRGMLSGALPYILFPMQIKLHIGTNQKMRTCLHPTPRTTLTLMPSTPVLLGDGGEEGEEARKLGGMVQENRGPQTGPQHKYIRQGQAAAGDYPLCKGSKTCCTLPCLALVGIFSFSFFFFFFLWLLARAWFGLGLRTVPL